MVTVQYANSWINNMSMEDLKNIPLRGAHPPRLAAHAGGRLPMSRILWRSRAGSASVQLGSVADIQQINTPTEVDHNQIRRVIDIYVATKTEALQAVGERINKLLANIPTRPQYRHRRARRGGEHEPGVSRLRHRAHHRDCCWST